MSTPPIPAPTQAEIDLMYQDLLRQPITEETADLFVRQWTAVHDRVEDAHSRLYLATTQNTSDEHAAAEFQAFIEGASPIVQRAEQQLRKNLLSSGVEPAQFSVQLREMRAATALFREANVSLLVEEEHVEETYNHITGAQTVEWEGETVPVTRLAAVLRRPERDVRERAWRTAGERRLQDGDAIHELWVQAFDLRRTIAGNADLPSFKAYKWAQLNRFDYTVGDVQRFHLAVEQVAVPALARLYEKRRRSLGVQTLRPWDLQVDPLGRPPLQPYTEPGDLVSHTAAMFHWLSPELGRYFDIMADEDLLDLESRPNKAPGGYCTAFAITRRPFIFMNAIGVHEDVLTLIHESGHAFHVFERATLPYYQQREVGMEFAEVASMAMEFLAGPALLRSRGGFYDPVDATRAEAYHLEQALALWCRIACIDAFQHALYDDPELARDAGASSSLWASLRRRFLPLVDWQGLEPFLALEWHAVLHIFVVPFYIIEYGLAQLGAVQIWNNARRDPEEALTRYRTALALGNTVPLPDLYLAAGAELSFAPETLRQAVSLIEQRLAELDDGSATPA